MTALDTPIYRIEMASRRAKGTRQVLAWDASAWIADRFESADAIRSRTGKAPIPHGANPVPEKDKANFIGVGSGFSPHTPRLKLALTVARKDGDAPLEDVWDGSFFRVGSWIVSDRLKRTLSAIDPDAFVFLPLETELVEAGSIVAAPAYWLCDTVRFLKAIETGRAELLAKASKAEVRFAGADLAGAMVFRDEEAPSEWVFCTGAFRDAVIQAGVAGMNFSKWGTRHD